MIEDIFKDVLIIYNNYNPTSPNFSKIMETVFYLEQFFQLNKIKYETYPNTEDINSQKDYFDLIAVIGGDGTLIGQIRKLAKYGYPFAGINCGTLGFLAEFKDVDEFKALEKYKIERRGMLSVSVCRNDKIVFSSNATNDAVIVAGPPFRIISFDLYNSNKEKISSYKADGIVFSTATGSTAYNLSAGGPIVHPNADVFCLTPISPHTISSRPMVVSSDESLEAKITSANYGTSLMIDGQEQFPLKYDDRVTVMSSTEDYRMLVNPKRKYWDVLKEKMKE